MHMQMQKRRAIFSLALILLAILSTHPTRATHLTASTTAPSFHEEAIRSVANALVSALDKNGDNVLSREELDSPVQALQPLRDQLDDASLMQLHAMVKEAASEGNHQVAADGIVDLIKSKISNFKALMKKQFLKSDAAPKKKQKATKKKKPGLFQRMKNKVAGAAKKAGGFLKKAGGMAKRAVGKLGKFSPFGMLGKLGKKIGQKLGKKKKKGGNKKKQKKGGKKKKGGNVTLAPQIVKQGLTIADEVQKILAHASKGTTTRIDKSQDSCVLCGFLVSKMTADIARAGVLNGIQRPIKRFYTPKELPALRPGENDQLRAALSNQGFRSSPPTNPDRRASPGVVFLEESQVSAPSTVMETRTQRAQNDAHYAAMKHIIDATLARNCEITMPNQFYFICEQLSTKQMDIIDALYFHYPPKHACYRAGICDSNSYITWDIHSSFPSARAFKKPQRQKPSINS